MEIAIKSKGLAMIQRIHDVHSQPLPIKSLQLAIDYADLEIVQWLAANRYDGLCLTCPPLQCGGDLRLLDCCLERRGPCPPSTRERLGIRRWLCDQGFSKCTAADGREAVENGDIETVRWILARQGRDVFSEFIYRSALQFGHFKLAAVLCEAGLRLGWQVTPIAILVPRDVEHLYSTELKLPKENKVIEVTRKEFPQRIQAWCREHWTYVTTDDAGLLKAIRDGDLEAAKWIRANTRLDEWSTWYSDAAKHGRLEVLKCLYGRECRFGHYDINEAAAKNGHLHILEWVNQVSPDYWSERLMIDAAEHGQLEVIKWPHTHRGEPQTTKLMETAAAHGNLSIVQWLHEHRSEGCTFKAMNKAAANGHLDVVKWLHDNRSKGPRPKQWTELRRTAICMSFNGFMSIDAKVAPRTQWMLRHKAVI